MTRGTTPTITITLPETFDLSQASHVYATIRQLDTNIRKSGEELNVSEHAVSFSLGQEDTLKLRSGMQAKIQLNWTYSDGKRGCTEITMLEVHDNLERGVLE